jgi:hypothetical protein
MPYRLLDLAKEALSSSVLNLHAAVVMAQPGLGRRLSPADVSAMEVAVEKGVGLVNFDGLLSAYPAAYAQMLGVTSTTTAKAVSVRIFDSTHPITQGNSSGHEYELVQPVDVADVGSLRDAEILLCAGQGQPAAFAKRLGQGKVVQFTLASKFWLPEYFGHVKLYVFSGSGLAYQFKEIPAFEGAQSVVVE